ncbi:MAG: type II toxin-antitoxin system HicA family toxin [Bacteroidales bacterium]|nr:type II toxin-antitoxin system HicA family toxin [Bacteroidales bacterium]
MKRAKLIKHIEGQGCYFLREGSNHTIYFNPQNSRISTIPRHSEIKFFIAQKICKDLEIIPPIER